MTENINVSAEVTPDGIPPEKAADDDKLSVLQEIAGLSADDIAPKKKSYRKLRLALFNAARIIVFAVCLCALILSLKEINDAVLAYYEGKEYYDSLGSVFNAEEKGLTGTVKRDSAVTGNEKFDKMLVSDGKLPDLRSDENVEKFLEVRQKLTQMREEMPDLYGWITIDGSEIDYPLVQGNDNLYYVDHAANKKYSEAGAIFVDCGCIRPTYNTQNLVIYGHNVRTMGIMFNGLVYFLEKQYFDSHDKIKVITFDGIYEYTIYSVYETSAYGEYTKKYFFDDGEFLSFQQRSRDNSMFRRGGEESLPFGPDARMITLSTCSNYVSNSEQRYTVIGIMTSAITE